MAFSERARAYAFEILEQRRAAAADKTADNRALLFERYPVLREYDRTIAAFGLSLARATMTGGADIASIRREMDEIESEKQRFLAAKGITGELTEPYAFCHSCNDTGYSDGKLCGCAKKLMRQYSLSEINRVSSLELSSFGAFSLEYYSSQRDETYGLSSKENMKRVLDCCVRYANGFPTGENLLMMGDAGLGKTHLALAVANEVLKRGHEVIYCSAANIFKQIETEYYEDGRSTDSADSLKRCDLLVLDDLGAEYVNAFTTSTVYDIINTRIIAKRATIYTTNIVRVETLETRYGEKVSSRLIGCCRLLSFFGDDIRLLKKN